jgi:hypothetical protein
MVTFKKGRKTRENEGREVKTIARKQKRLIKKDVMQLDTSMMKMRGDPRSTK